MAHLNGPIQNNPTTLHLPEMPATPGNIGSSTTPAMSTIFQKKQRKLLQFGQKESDLALGSLKGASSIGADHNFKSIKHRLNPMDQSHQKAGHSTSYLASLSRSMQTGGVGHRNIILHDSQADPGSARDIAGEIPPNHLNLQNLD